MLPNAQFIRPFDLGADTITEIHPLVNCTGFSQKMTGQSRLVPGAEGQRYSPASAGDRLRDHDDKRRVGVNAGR